jgi:hypothetical protein
MAGDRGEWPRASREFFIPGHFVALLPPRIRIAIIVANCGAGSVSQARNFRR